MSAAPNALALFADITRWVTWRNEPRADNPGKLTKVPYQPDERKASSTSPKTWRTRAIAESVVAKIVNGHGGGIGIVLGDLGDGFMLAGIDMDTCRHSDGSFEPWAETIIKRFVTYTEISPSGCGAKLFFLVQHSDFEAIEPLLNSSKTGRQFKKTGAGDHPPGFEIYFKGRYFAVTDALLDGCPDTLATIGHDDLRWLISEAGPALARKETDTKAGKGITDNSRSAAAFRIGLQTRRDGASFEAFCDAVRDNPETAGWYSEKGIADGGRELQRIWEKAASNSEGWRAKLIVNKRGEPLALESNAMLMMREHPDIAGLFGLDEFHQSANLMHAPPWAGHSDKKFPRPVRDADLSELLAWLQQQGIHLHGRGPVRIALASVIRDHTFHPVRDYLDKLIWDRKPRLDNWLTYYLGVTPIENYTAQVARCWTISAVARIYQPGCIAKYVLTIEGPQDLGKSTALRILGSPWFTDDIATLGSKDSQMQVGNAWIIELAELDSTRRADVNAIKSFISRPVDRFRPPYCEHLIDQQRQCVLAATVNPAGDYLHDETGAVRFWPVAALKIDLDALRSDRDQVWAEAVARYKAGEQWWPDDTFRPTEEQEARSETAESDPWFDLVKDWLRRQTASSFTASDILSGALEIPMERMDKRAERRLGAILRRLQYISGGVRVDGVPVRRWRLKPTTDERP